MAVRQDTYKIRRFALVTGEWTPILAPINCNYYIVIGNEDGTDMLRSSDPADPQAQYKMVSWYSMTAPAPIQGHVCRFKAGDVVTYLQALSGVGPAVVEFIL